MVLLDFFIIIVMLIAIYAGYYKGFGMSVLYILVWLICVVISQPSSPIFQGFYTFVYPYITDYAHDSVIASGVSSLIFGLFMVLAGFVLKILGLFMLVTKMVGGNLSRIIGSFFGAVYGLIVVFSLHKISLPVITYFIPLQDSWLLGFVYHYFPSFSNCFEHFYICVSTL